MVDGIDDVLGGTTFLNYLYWRLPLVPVVFILSQDALFRRILPWLKVFSRTPVFACDVFAHPCLELLAVCCPTCRWQFCGVFPNKEDVRVILFFFSVLLGGTVGVPELFARAALAGVYGILTKK